MQDLAESLGIEDSSVSNDLESFWTQVALAVGVPSPLGNSVELLKQVVERLNMAWDDDYLDEGGATPSVMAYEQVYANLPRAPHPLGTGGAIGEEISEEEGDEGEVQLAVAAPVRYRFSSVELETIVKRIQDGRWDLNPDWQRTYVWKSKKQRRFIESILLNLPIPSLLLFEDKATHKAYVIDGKQRLETIARFCAPKGDPLRKRYKTFPKSTEGWGQGQPLEKAAGKYYGDLPREWKSKIDECSLHIFTFEDLPSDKLYQIFSRYNTGAVQLKAAEIRNAVFQKSNVHKMMWGLAGEHQDPAKHRDSEERETAALLRATMRGKKDRYGAYDFVGRYFAFAHTDRGETVARATYEFMTASEGATPEAIEQWRQEFMRVFRKTCEWYHPYELTTPRPQREFHAFLATVQLVSTRRMLFDFIDKGTRKEEEVKEHIGHYWAEFAEHTLRLKQNSTNFWGRQVDWVESLENRARPKVPEPVAPAVASPSGLQPAT